MFFKKSHYLSVLGLGIGLASIVVAVKPKTPPPPFQPAPNLGSLAFNPPIVLKMSLQHEPSARPHKGQLEVVYFPDPRLDKTLTLDLEGEKRTFRNMGSVEVDCDPLTLQLIKNETGKDLKGKVRGLRFVGDIDVTPSDIDFVKTPQRLFGRSMKPTVVFDQREPLGRLAPVLEKPIKLERGGELLRLPVFFSATPPNPAKCLMITDPSVVNDPARTFDPCTNHGTPMGKWTFGFLMTQMANQQVTGINPSDFVEKWLKTWLTAQTVPGTVAPIPPRPSMQNILNAWPKINGKLNLAKAPFKLVAIVNRLDLAQNSAYGGGDAGEGRFIFALTQQCNPVSFMLILEYGVPIKGCAAVKQYAQQWMALDAMTIGSPTYLTSLEHLTDTFSLKNLAPTKPNKSSINQVRTNEIPLGNIWEFREFHLVGTNSQLTPAALVKNPDPSLNRTQALTNYANANTSAILADTYTLPAQIAGASDRYTPANFWDGIRTPPNSGPATIMNAQARFKLSLNACSGCHARETNTFFTHVGPTGALSQFLTGSLQPVIDPGQPFPPGSWTSQRSFHDLADRAVKLANRASAPCFMHLVLRPLKFVH